ncbi:gamma-glutamylcyclotransferase family protein [Desulfosporosinus sp. SYSU MS00001]|uniref:gamma-glutamylcyclotransferase family protein n=1 Tax=Desulfosporosinus sp. SYSU MS00001 TaxID=3416284 RepID=UPI003CEEE337
MNNIFVYGTLLSGRVNHPRFLKDQQFLGSAILEGYNLYNIGWFPGAIKSGKSDDKVRGEVYRIDDNTLRRIDFLEDNGELYLRRYEKVKMIDGSTLEAFVYEFQKEVQEENMVSYLNQPWN